ncbi:MAG TPA: hypothetical protein PKD80_14265 [Microthrixaceae bacterium]|nr:hypothetical protein [Microthrixaceae bacterium]HMT25835.1 hypothetical protein [Microthrixaceae bacterium]HMT60935.1 hypothetical protein [Microthrixaceae bacterium]
MTMTWADGHCQFEQVPFRRVFEQVRRVVPPDAEMVTAYTDGQVTLRSNRSKTGYHEASDFSGYQGVVPGDFVVHGLDILRGSVGVSDAAGAITSVCTICRPRIECDPRYFAYAIRAQAMSGLPRALAKGVREGGADFRRWDTLAELPLPLPSPPEQRAIADFLDTETARIDALITKKRRLIELLTEADRALVDDVFGRSYERSTVRLARLARLQTGLTLDSARGVESGAVTLPYLRVANVQADRVDFAEIKEVTVPSELADRCRLRPGDVLMTEGGDLDKLGRGTVWAAEIPECLHQNHVFAVRPDRARLLPEFLAMLTRTSFARKYFESTGTRSTNLASTNSSKVLDFRVPLVGVERQRTALDRYAQRAGRLIQCGRALAEQIDLLVEYRQALITAAVTGELEIPRVAA